MIRKLGSKYVWLIISLVFFVGFLLRNLPENVVSDLSAKKEVCKFYPVEFNYENPWVLMPENYKSTDSSFLLNFRNLETESQYIYQVITDSSTYDDLINFHGETFDRIMLDLNPTNQLLDTGVVYVNGVENQTREYLMYFSGNRVGWQKVFYKLDSGFYISIQILVMIKNASEIPEEIPKEFEDFEMDIFD